MTQHTDRRDVGPRVVLARGERELVDIPDIDRPKAATVRVSRTRWLPLEMHARGTLTREGLDAAVRFRDDYELSQGAKDGIAAAAPEARGGFGTRCPTQVALDAQARVRHALMAVGKQGSVVMTLAVTGNATCEQLAATTGFTVAHARHALVTHLTRLAEHYAEVG